MGGLRISKPVDRIAFAAVERLFCDKTAEFIFFT